MNNRTTFWKKSSTRFALGKGNLERRSEASQEKKNLKEKKRGFFFF